MVVGVVVEGVGDERGEVGGAVVDAGVVQRVDLESLVLVESTSAVLPGSVCMIFLAVAVGAVVADAAVAAVAAAGFFGLFFQRRLHF